MRKWILFRLIGIFICAGFIVIIQSLPDSQPYVVLIRALDKEGQVKWSGSGYFVRSDLILTAGHIVQDTKEFEIVLPSGKIRPAFFEYQEDVNLVDVGLIRIRGDYPVIHFGKSAQLGQDVWIAGYGLGEMPFTLTRGIVSCVDRHISFFGKLPLLQVDASAWPGHSGSPVLDNDNYVVGIHVGKHPGDECWSLNVPVDIIKLVLTKYDATRALGNTR